PRNVSSATAATVHTRMWITVWTTVCTSVDHVVDEGVENRYLHVRACSPACLDKNESRLGMATAHPFVKSLLVSQSMVSQTGLCSRLGHASASGPKTASTAGLGSAPWRRSVSSQGPSRRTEAPSAPLPSRRSTTRPSWPPSGSAVNADAGRTKRIQVG